VIEDEMMRMAREIMAREEERKRNREVRWVGREEE